MKNPFDDSMRDVNGRFLIHNEQLKRWREHFITILTYLASFEIRFIGDDMTIRCGELFQTEKKLSSNINARSKGVKHRPCRSSYGTAKCKVLHRSKMRNFYFLGHTFYVVTSLCFNQYKKEDYFRKVPLPLIPYITIFCEKNVAPLFAYMASPSIQSTFHYMSLLCKSDLP